MRATGRPSERSAPASRLSSDVTTVAMEAAVVVKQNCLAPPFGSQPGQNVDASHVAAAGLSAAPWARHHQKTGTHCHAKDPTMEQAAPSMVEHSVLLQGVSQPDPVARNTLLTLSPAHPLWPPILGPSNTSARSSFQRLWMGEKYPGGLRTAIGVPALGSDPGCTTSQQKPLRVPMESSSPAPTHLTDRLGPWFLAVTEGRDAGGLSTISPQTRSCGRSSRASKGDWNKRALLAKGRSTAASQPRAAQRVHSTYSIPAPGSSACPPYLQHPSTGEARRVHSTYSIPAPGSSACPQYLQHPGTGEARRVRGTCDVLAPGSSAHPQCV
ncbi:hypothetical protein TREES_T100014935 [Tupaia chinensis]|uniref:Uncharacterized protein n=1 Tax=Tupaia chinensis TaxID=246437 RepID=L9KQ14_TUPCH|nr:hypothetical protein TREES_T100014935 [Tupaia chinensis]